MVTRTSDVGWWHGARRNKVHVYTTFLFHRDVWHDPRWLDHAMTDLKIITSIHIIQSKRHELITAYYIKNYPSRYHHWTLAGTTIWTTLRRLLVVRIWVRFFLTRLRLTQLSQHFHNTLSIPESNQVCPDYGEGIYDEFSQDMIDTFASFTLAYSSSFLLLEDDNGSSECYPFGESVGPLEGYAESAYP